MRSGFLAFALSLAACGGTAPNPEYLKTEFGFLRTGVDRDAELREVKRVLAQRKLAVVAEQRSLALIAVGAASAGEQNTAVRVISQRGVVHAEDAALDDLFHPGRVVLVESLPPSIEDMDLYAFRRIGKGRDRGCVSVGRVLPDGTAVPVTLDVGLFGERACVTEVIHAGGGKLRATIAWPELSYETAPTLDVLLGFPRQKLDAAPQAIRVARIEPSPELADAEEARLSELARAPAFAQRHAAAVGRAALALLRDEGRDQQIGIYRETLGGVRPGTVDAELVAETVLYIERGWSDTERSESADQSSANGPEQPVEPDAIVIEPEPLPSGSNAD